MHALVTLTATLVVATISGLIIAVAPRLERRDVHRAAYGDPDQPEPGDRPASTTEIAQRL